MLIKCRCENFINILKSVYLILIYRIIIGFFFSAQKWQVSFTLVFSVGGFFFFFFFFNSVVVFKTDRQRVCWQSKFETWLSLAEILEVFSNFLDSIHSRHMNAHCRLLSCSRWSRYADGVRGLIKGRLQYGGRLTVMKCCTAGWDTPSWLTSLFVWSFETWNSSNIKKNSLCPPKTQCSFTIKLK